MSTDPPNNLVGDLLHGRIPQGSAIAIKEATTALERMLKGGMKADNEAADILRILEHHRLFGMGLQDILEEIDRVVQNLGTDTERLVGLTIRQNEPKEIHETIERIHDDMDKLATLKNRLKDASANEHKRAVHLAIVCGEEIDAVRKGQKRLEFFKDPLWARIGTEETRKYITRAIEKDEEHYRTLLDSIHQTIGAQHTEIEKKVVEGIERLTALRDHVKSGKIDLNRLVRELQEEVAFVPSVRNDVGITILQVKTEIMTLRQNLHPKPEGDIRISLKILHKLLKAAKASSTS